MASTPARDAEGDLIADVGMGARISPTLRWATLAVLSVGFLAVGLHQAARDAPTVDEGVDVSSGVAALVEHDLRMVPEHPVLPKALAAVPTLLADPIVPKTAAWDEGDWFDWSDDFVRANDQAGRLDDIFLLARIVVLLETVGCAVLLYVLTARFFGPDGGLLAAVAWLTTPYVVGLGHFAMIDIPFVLATLGLCILLARWADQPTTVRAVALGAGLGGVLATRHTGLVLAAVVVAVMAHQLRGSPREAARSLGIVGVVSVVGLWLVYRGLAPGGSSDHVEDQFRALVAQGGDGSLPVRLIGALPLPLEWRAGFAYLDLTSTDRPSSLFGRSWDGGHWWFFPASALLKLPAVVAVGIVGGWLVAAVHGRTRRNLVRFVVAPAVMLWLLLVAQPLNLGLRLAMPVVALAYVGLGALAPPTAAGTPRARHRFRAAVVVILMVVQAGSSIAALPHSLAWSPVPWTPAYRWVSDSSLDAGQALYEVRGWAMERTAPYVAIDSTRGLAVEGGSRSLAGVSPATVRGWVAVGVTPLMQTRREELAWLRKYCPVDTLGGGSVLVYRFASSPDPAPGPERPVAPCLGADRSRRR